MTHSDHLLSLCGIVAGLIPSEHAIEHASLEWQMARELWLQALESLGIPEEAMRAAGGVSVAAGIKAMMSA